MKKLMSLGILIMGIQSDAAPLHEVSVGTRMTLSDNFFKGIRRAGLSNKDGSGPAHIAIFQLRENRWNKTRLDLSKPYCLVHLNGLEKRPVPRPLEVERVISQPTYPSGFAGVTLEFTDPQIKSIGCFQAEANSRKGAEISLKTMQETLGARVSMKTE